MTNIEPAPSADEVAVGEPAPVRVGDGIPTADVIRMVNRTMVRHLMDGDWD